MKLNLNLLSSVYPGCGPREERGIEGESDPVAQWRPFLGRVPISTQPTNKGCPFFPMEIHWASEESEREREREVTQPHAT